MKQKRWVRIAVVFFALMIVLDDIFQGSIFGSKGVCERGKSIPTENIT